MREENFVGVIFGGDMNSYAVARAFYEAYKIKTIVIGRYPLYPTTFSKLIEGYYYEDLLKDEVMLKALEDVDKLYPNKKKIVLSNTDYYVKQVIHNKDKIDYSTYEHNGWFVGSGAIESSNKTVVQLRLKQAGIIDPTSVEKCAISTAISVAGVFLTTECAITKENTNPLREDDLLS